MNPKTTPVITFVGLSGTGKTTFLEKLIPVLKARGHRFAVVKHDVHKFEIDKPGKDTYRFTAAGADVVAIANAEKFAMVERVEEDPGLDGIISRLPETEFVLTEGYKKNRSVKIEIHRKELGNPIITPQEELLAVMTDEPLTGLGVRCLPLEDIPGCADLVEAWVAAFGNEQDMAKLMQKNS